MNLKCNINFKVLIITMVFVDQLIHIVSIMNHGVSHYIILFNAVSGEFIYLIDLVKISILF